MFDIVFAGQIKPNLDIKVVKEHIAGLLKLDSTKVESLFSGKKTVIKSGIDKETALKYQQAFAARGAILHILPKANPTAQTPPTQSTQKLASPPPNQPTAQQTPPKPTAPPTSASAANLKKLVAVADDPYKEAFKDIDAFDFGLKANGEALSVATEEKVEVVENKAFSFAPQGSDMKEIDTRKYEEIVDNPKLKF